MPNNLHSNDGNNDCHVPIKYPEYPALGSFVNKLRIGYRKSLNAAKAQEEKGRNEAAIVHYPNWKYMYYPPSTLKIDCGIATIQGGVRDVNVPLPYEPNSPLGSFVNNQRALVSCV